MRRGQISVEYLIIVGFIVFIVIGMIGVAFFYTSSISDGIKSNQLDRFADKVISSSEAVFFAGEPSKVTVNAFLPGGVEAIFTDGDDLVFNVSTSSGKNIISFESDVLIIFPDGISISEGVKRLEIVAGVNNVSVREG